METARLKIHAKTHHKVSAEFLRAGLNLSSKKVVIAVSGGMDSTLLAHHCKDFEKKFGLSFVIAHINHKQRGQASEEDEVFCRNLATQLGFDFVSQTLNLQEREKTNSESILRAARYAALMHIQRKINADKVLLAHHANDQAETFLLRLMDGADIRGLGSMRYLRNGTWLRPLLKVEKSDIEKEVFLRSIAYREDATNASTSFKRNFVRHNIIPLMRVHGNPKLIAHLCELSHSLSDVDDYLQHQAKLLTERCWLDSNTYDLKELAQAHVAVLRVALQMQYETAFQGLSLTRKHIYMLELAVYKGQGNKIIQLPAGKSARIHNKKLQWF